MPSWTQALARSVEGYPSGQAGVVVRAQDARATGSAAAAGAPALRSPRGTACCLPGSSKVSADIDELERRMAAAAEATDFEEARRLRDRIALIRSGVSPAEAARTDTSGLARQQPGAMGIGTSRPTPVRPTGWKPPSKPDPLVSRRSRRK